MKNREQGFSLLELLVALAILLVVTAFVVSAFTSSIRTVKRDNALAERDADVKRALELMTLEIGQAGATPDMLDFTNTSAAASNPLTAGSTIVTGGIMGSTVKLQNTTNPTEVLKGLYPGRPIILGLPEGSANSEKLQIALVNTCSPNNCIQTTSPPMNAHASPDNAISSPTLPLMFGVLNPPPSPMALTKSIGAEVGGPTPGAVRLGVVGDILSDGVLRYAEYTFYQGRLYRSLTAINQPFATAKKEPAYIMLENVDNVDFKLVYPDVNTPIPVAVQVTIIAHSSVPEPVLTGGNRTTAQVQQLFKTITARTEIVPRGNYAASVIFGAGGESQLRSMAPPCQTGNVGYPPCTVWSSTAPWSGGDWNNLFNFARKAYNDTSTGAPGTNDNLL